MSATKFIAVGVLFILCTSSISCQDEEAEGPTVTIEPFRLSIEVGQEAVFGCSFSHPNNVTHISWFYPDNVTEVGMDYNTTRIYVDEESQLHVRNAQENDTGLYLCKVTFGDSIVTVPGVTFTTAMHGDVTFTTAMHGDVTVTHLPVSSSTVGRVTFLTDDPGNGTLAERIPNPQEVGTAGTGAPETPEIYNATADLNVYVMPTYFTEGMIILGINLGLLLVFLICLAQSLVSERKRMQGYYKK